MSFKVTCYPKQPILSTHSIKKTYVGKILQWENKNAITKKKIRVTKEQTEATSQTSKLKKP